jgi:PAS domain S-box-containing protein
VGVTDAGVPATDGPIRVLCVEDDAGVAETTAAVLEETGDRFEARTAAGPAAALDAVETGAVDCVVADYNMAEMDGIALCRALSDRGLDVPFVLFTGAGSEEVASEAVSAGVDDYVRKRPREGQYTVLAARVERVVDRDRSRAALEASQRRLSLFVEQSPLGVVEYDESFEIVSVNPAAESIFGYDEADLVGESWEKLVTEESHADVEAVETALSADAGGYHSVDENVRADGERIVCEWHNRVVTDDDGEVVAVFALCQDVTDRERRKERLRQTTAQYEALVESFPDGGVFMFDHDLTYTVAGGEGLSAVGLSESDVVGATPHDLFPPDVASTTADYYRRALDGEHHTYELEYRGDWWRALVRPVRDDCGEVVSGMAVSQNVTDQRDRLDRLNRQKERLDEFASLVSHDLRNPLSVAEGYLDLARSEHDSDHLATVAEAHDRMRRLIDDLLTLARAESTVGTPSAHSLAEVAEAGWRTVETGDATLDPPPERSVRAEQGRLQRLFENLFRNSVEHGSTGNRTAGRSGDAVEPCSTGSRTTGSSDGVTVTVGTLDDGFYVADDGPGVPEADREKVFRAGYSTTDDGTGFGLRIVEQVAEAHGWSVALTESESGGARFEVRGVEFD